jgi:hypothetical protein
LRELRESRSLTVAHAISVLEWSKPRLWRYETGQVPIHPNLPGLVPVRDTKDRDGGTLVFAADSWAAFVDGVKGGEFDLPA